MLGPNKGATDGRLGMDQQMKNLHKAPLIAELTESQQRALAGKAGWLTFPSGSCIVNQHDGSDLIYVIVSGFVKISRQEEYRYPPRPDGLPERRRNSRRQLICSLRGPGDIVGQVPSILETGMATDAIALTTCQLVTIPCQDFLVCIQSHPGFAQAVTFKIARNRVQTARQSNLQLLPCN